MNQLIDSIASSSSKLKRYTEPREIRNDASRFLSVGPNEASNKIDWEVFYSAFMMCFMQKKLKYNSFEEWKKQFIDELRLERKYKDIIEMLDEVYLSENVIRQLTPLGFALLQSRSGVSGKTLTLLNQFETMLGCNYKYHDFLEYNNNNFLEEIILTNLERSFEDIKPNKLSKPYLPFLADLFLKDLIFLFKNQKVFMKEYKNFFGLYNFIYVAQLSLNLDRSPLTIPRSHRLYFILDIETASKERVDLYKFGFYSLFEENGSCWKLFPYLTYLNLISNKYEDDEVPTLWGVCSQNNNNNEILAQLIIMNDLLGELFESNLKRDVVSTTLSDELKYGLKLQYHTFEKENTKSQRHGANYKVQKFIKENYGAEYVKFRGAAGTFLELKADIILLLTNMIIGERAFIHIDEIVDGLQNRGIWLDIQSKSALVEFYESIGNAEKLSDSGDAVYVKRTF